LFALAVDSDGHDCSAGPSQSITNSITLSYCR